MPERSKQVTGVSPSEIWSYWGRATTRSASARKFAVSTRSGAREERWSLKGFAVFCGLQTAYSATLLRLTVPQMAASDELCQLPPGRQEITSAKEGEVISCMARGFNPLTSHQHTPWVPRPTRVHISQVALDTDRPRHMCSNRPRIILCIMLRPNN